MPLVPSQFGPSASALAVIGLLLAGTANAQEFNAGELVIEHPWARPAPIGTGAAYMTIDNTGGASDRLLGATAEVAERAELHSHEVDAQGIARMRPVEAVEIAAHSTVALAPGQLHIMLIGLEQPLKLGVSFPLVLNFERAGPVTVQVAVQMRPSHAGHQQGHATH